MIRSEHEYRAALSRYRQEREEAERRREALLTHGLATDQIEAAMQPVVTFHAQLGEELTWYEGVRRGDIAPVRRLADLGRLLIALRIASGLSQKQLAHRLHVSEAAVSRDERNEYHGITLERAQRVLDALGASIAATVESIAGRA